MIQVLFICRLNTVCSPLAACIFEDISRKAGLQDKFTILSTGAYPGNAVRGADRRIVAIAQQQTLDLSRHQTTEIDRHVALASTYIIALDEDSYWRVDALYREASKDRSTLPTLQLLTETSGQMGQRSMPDPVLGESSFEELFTLTYEYVNRLFDYIVKRENVLSP